MRPFVIVAFASVLLCLGCARAKPVVGPDGQAGWFEITCTGGDDECYRKAHEVCPNDYRTADGSDGAAETECSSSPGSMMIMGNGAMMGTPPSSHCSSKLLIKCLR